MVRRGETSLSCMCLIVVRQVAQHSYNNLRNTNGATDDGASFELPLLNRKVPMIFIIEFIEFRSRLIAH